MVSHLAEQVLHSTVTQKSVEVDVVQHQKRKIICYEDKSYELGAVKMGTCGDKNR